MIKTAENSAEKGGGKKGLGWIRAAGLDGRKCWMGVLERSVGFKDEG